MVIKSIGQLRFFNTWGGIKRVLLRGHRALMNFPQKFCPLCVKKNNSKCLRD